MSRYVRTATDLRTYYLRVILKYYSSIIGITKDLDFSLSSSVATWYALASYYDFETRNCRQQLFCQVYKLVSGYRLRFSKHLMLFDNPTWIALVTMRM